MLDTNNIVNFPNPRHTGNRDVTPLINTLRSLIMNHLSNIPHLQIGDANPNLREEVEAMFQGSVSFYGQYSYTDQSTGATKYGKQVFLRKMWSSNPHDANALDDFSCLANGDFFEGNTNPDHGACFYSPAQFRRIVKNIMFARTAENIKRRNGTAPSPNEIYDGHYQVWMLIKDLQSISYYTPMRKRRDGTTEPFDWPDEDMIDALPTMTEWTQKFDANKRGTARIYNTPLKPSQQADEATKVGEEPQRILNPNTGSYDLIAEPSEDALDHTIGNGCLPADEERRLNRDNNHLRRMLGHYR